MTNQEILVQYLIKNPSATNGQIANDMEMSEGYVKKSISTLKKATVIEVTKVCGERYITVYPERLKTRSNHMYSDDKKLYLEQMLDIVFEALDGEKQMENIVNAGHLVIKLLDRM